MSNESMTPYRRLSDALCKAGAHCIAEGRGFNKDQSFELWRIPGRMQPVLIQRYGNENGSAGFQDWHPNAEMNVEKSIAAILAKD